MGFCPKQVDITITSDDVITKQMNIRVIIDQTDVIVVDQTSTKLVRTVLARLAM